MTDTPSGDELEQGINSLADELGKIVWRRHKGDSRTEPYWLLDRLCPYVMVRLIRRQGQVLDRQEELMNGVLEASRTLARESRTVTKLTWGVFILTGVVVVSTLLLLVKG